MLYNILWASQVALVVKNQPINAGDIRNVNSMPGSGTSPGGGHGNPLQYSCLEYPIDRGAWQSTVYQVFSFSHFFPFGVMFRRLSGITSFNLLILGARHRAWHIASTQYLRTGTTYFSLSKLGNSLITASFT